MKNDLVRARVNGEQKEKATKLLAAQNITLSSAVQMFLASVISNGGLPPSILCSNEKLNKD